MTANLFIQSNNLLGEGPVWDHQRNELIWVDIEKNLLCFCNVKTGYISEIEMDSKPGAVVPLCESSKYLLALQSGLKYYDRRNGTYQLIAHPEKNIKNNRFNDGKCDLQGRFWIGSMDVNAKAGMGKLYLMDEQENLDQKLENLSIANGLAFYEDKMYFIDSATYTVVQYSINKTNGNLQDAKDVIKVPKAHGLPDGMCIDSEGMLWVAHWGGGSVSRWNPLSGELMQKINVPVPNVTSCCFGGEKLNTLYITTASVGLTQDEIKKYPLSGCVFSAKPGINGLKANYYKKI